MALVYSCCFWFSLRLGGILIGIFSILQGTAILICCCLAYSYWQVLEDLYTEWDSQYNLGYSKNVMDRVMEDPHKYISWAIVCECMYLFTCVCYMYGAYILSNILMAPFIFVELMRLLFVVALVATSLLLLKENTMDIGSLIGASIVAGFFLLGMFYLWVCAANLPILINEMERDDQAATIAKLQELLYSNPKPARGFDSVSYGPAEDQYFTRDVFVVSNRNVMARSKNPVPSISRITKTTSHNRS